MAIAINDLQRITDPMIATAGQTVFTYGFPILDETHLKVYQRAAGSSPDDATDLLTLGVDYTVTGVGSATGGTFVLTVGATLNDILIAFGDAPIARTSYYTTAFTADGINDDLEYQTIFNRINESVRQQRIPTYPISAVVASADLVLPILGASQIWVMNSTRTEIEAVDIPSGGGGSGGAPIDATYITQTTNTTLTNEFALNSLADGILKHASGVPATAVAGTDYLVELSQDATPQLGGNLDLNSRNINGTGNWNANVITQLYGGTNLDTSGVTDGQLLIGDSTGNKFALNTLTAGAGISITNGSSTVTVSTSVTTTIAKNFLIGGDMRVNPWQRGVTFTAATTPANNDDTYLIDRWVLLSDGNDIVDVSQDTDLTAKFLVATANKKFGIVQIIENLNCQEIIGDTVSIGVRAKASGNIVGNLRMALISWDSTADTVTSDVVSAWEATGTNPTLAANWTYENVAVDLAVTGTFTTFTIEGIDIDTASATNVGLFIWCDATNANVSDTLNIEQVMIERGSTFNGFEEDDEPTTLAKCQRYYSKSYSSDKYAGDTGAAGQCYFNPGPTQTVAFGNGFSFQTTMRTVPTVTLYDLAGTSGSIYLLPGPVAHGATAQNPNENRFWCQKSATGSGYTGFYFHYTADAEL